MIIQAALAYDDPTVDQALAVDDQATCHAVTGGAPPSEAVTAEAPPIEAVTGEAHPIEAVIGVAPPVEAVTGDEASANGNHYGCGYGKCKKIFCSEVKAKEHRNKKHPAERKYKCNFCNKTFQALQGLRVHEKYKRTGCLFGLLLATLVNN